MRLPWLLLPLPCLGSLISSDNPPCSRITGHSQRGRGAMDVERSVTSRVSAVHPH